MYEVRVRCCQSVAPCGLWGIIYPPSLRDGGINNAPLYSFSDEKNRSAFMGALAPAGLRQRAEMRAGARKKPPMEPRAPMNINIAPDILTYPL